MPKGLIVVGMHRSGTSAVAGALQQIGVDFGPGDKLLGADAGVNAKGYWENRDVVMLNERLLLEMNSSWDDLLPLPKAWMERSGIQFIKADIVELLQRDFSMLSTWAIKDPRLCKLLPVWQTAFSELNIFSSYVIVVRHPFEVAKSLHKRDGMVLEKGLVLWLESMLSAVLHTADEERVFVSYAELLGDPVSVLKRVSHKFNLRFGESGLDAVKAFVSEDLQHQAAGEMGPTNTGLIGEWAVALFEVLSGCSRSAGECNMNRFYEIEAAFDSALLPFLPMLRYDQKFEEIHLLRKNISEATAARIEIAEAYQSLHASYNELHGNYQDLHASYNELHASYKDLQGVGK